MSVSVASCGLSYASPSKVGGTGTGVKIFPSLLSSTAAALVSIPTSLAGRRIEIVASGNLFVHGTSPTVGFALQLGSSLVSAANFNFASAANSTQSLTTATYYPFSLLVTLSGDANSDAIQGINGTFYVGGNSVTTTLVTSQTGSPTGSPPLSGGVNWSSNGSALDFVFGISYGVSDALNAASLQQFEAFA